MYQLTKTFRFEAAHRLALGYEGKCANPHGHSWNGEVCIETDAVDEQGMALDYAILKRFTKAFEDAYDHALLLHNSDTELLSLCIAKKWKYVVFSKNPTSETLANQMFDVFKEQLRVDYPHIKVKYVKIDETCTTSCKYYEA